MATLVCVPIMVVDPDAALRDAAAARAAGADLVEFRLDMIFHGEGDEAGLRAAVRLVSESPLPCIATCRLADEGGFYDGDEPSRIALFERLGTAFGTGERPPRFIDVELATYERSHHVRLKINLAVTHPEQLAERHTSLILSIHDVSGRPPDLTRRVARMRREPAARVLKVAWQGRSLRDNLEAFDLLAGRDRPMIALVMGEFGLMSRVLAPKFGGFLTFASLRPESATAPGQPTVAELLDLYRFRTIGPETAVYGVVGYPVAQSLSPHVHNAGFAAAGRDAVYLPLPVAPGYESLKATLLELRHYLPLNLAGISVTSPHKDNIVRLALEQGWAMDAATRAIGAGNTLVIERGPSQGMDREGSAAVRLLNTDASALADEVRRALGTLEGRTVGVAGTGGMGRAAVFGLLTAGARVVIASRERRRAEAVAAWAEQVVPGRCTACTLDEVPAATCDAWINCTPVGMAGGPVPEVQPFVLPPPDSGTLIVDTVYRPRATPLLRRARQAGLPTLDGLGLFVAQAEAQFQAWTGAAPPAGLFVEVCRRALAHAGETWEDSGRLFQKEEVED